MCVITIVGAGMMGSAMSIPAADNGHEVRLVGTPLDREIIERLRTDGVHPKHQRKLPETVRFLQIEELGPALAGADLLINGVSSFGVDWCRKRSAASSIASTIWPYPVHRQRLPEIAFDDLLVRWCNGAREQRVRREHHADVQYPHCNPCVSQNASCTTVSSPGAGASPRSS